MFIGKKKLEQLITKAQNEVRNEFYERQSVNNIWDAIGKSNRSIFKIKDRLTIIEERLDILERAMIEKGGKK